MEAQKLARKERVSSQIIANNDNVANIDFSQEKQYDDANSDNGCSHPQKRKRFLDKIKEKKDKKYPKVNKWKNSDHESCSSNCETIQHFDNRPIPENEILKNEERNKCPGCQRMKRSSWFVVDLKNTKLQQSKFYLVDMEIHNAYHKWFEISSAAGRANSYKINAKYLPFAKQFNVLLNTFDRKKPCANISDVFSYF